MILDIWTKYGKSVILPAIVCAGFIVYFLLSKDQPSPEPILLTAATEQQTPEQQPTDPQPTEQQAQSIVVDVKGAVQHPGVYPFTTEDRIIDAITAAGGYVENADTRSINHAQKLTDELVIYVPKKGEQVEEALAPATSAPSSSASGAKNSETVNINTATESELTTLPGIGPSKAAAIIAYRDEHGPFATPQDITNVTGIGDKTFERLEPFIAIK